MPVRPLEWDLPAATSYERARTAHRSRFGSTIPAGGAPAAGRPRRTRTLVHVRRRGRRARWRRRAGAARAAAPWRARPFRRSARGDALRAAPVVALPTARLRTPSRAAQLAALGITAAEGFAALERVLAAGVAHAVVTPFDVDAAAARLTRPVVLERTPAPIEGELPAVAATAPRDRVERLLHGAFAHLLGTADAGIDGDFFELGGHSLLAVRLFARLHRELGVDLERCRRAQRAARQHRGDGGRLPGGVAAAAAQWPIPARRLQRRRRRRLRDGAEAARARCCGAVRRHARLTVPAAAEAFGVRSHAGALGRTDAAGARLSARHPEDEVRALECGAALRARPRRRRRAAAGAPRFRAAVRVRTRVRAAPRRRLRRAGVAVPPPKCSGSARASRTRTTSVGHRSSPTCTSGSAPATTSACARHRTSTRRVRACGPRSTAADRPAVVARGLADPIRS